MNRREFIKEGFWRLLKTGLELLDSDPFLETLQKEKTSALRIKQRPPGAPASDALFQSRCIGCDACMAACPVNVIFIEDLKARLPLIYPETNPCLCCADYPCIRSCPVGALRLENGVDLKTIEP